MHFFCVESINFVADNNEYFNIGAGMVIISRGGENKNLDFCFSDSNIEYLLCNFNIFMNVVSENFHLSESFPHKYIRVDTPSRYNITTSY